MASQPKHVGLGEGRKKGVAAPSVKAALTLLAYAAITLILDSIPPFFSVLFESPPDFFGRLAPHIGYLLLHYVSLSGCLERGRR